MSQDFELLKTKNERLNIDLGEPYLFIIESAIKKGYAGNKSEVIRHALKAFEREMNENEEAILVKKDVDEMMAKIKSGELKTKPYSETRKKYGIK
jgi:Arc/MetJ-type ribon-helix-helix transcriptional regulator